MNDQTLVQWPLPCVTTKICLHDGCSCGPLSQVFAKGGGQMTIPDVGKKRAWHEHIRLSYACEGQSETSMTINACSCNYNAPTTLPQSFTPSALSYEICQLHDTGATLTQRKKFLDLLQNYILDVLMRPDLC